MIGARLADRYEVTEELGRGGMGVVYRARDPVLNRDVAAKLIPPMLLTPDAEERFQREAQIVAQMNHPSIVPIFDVGRHEGALFFLMPVISGRNLRRYLSEKSRSVGDVVEIGIRVAEALEYSHARGVIHRDVKPENIMISDDDGALRVYVMDFGLAKASSENRLTKTGTLVGTVAYLSPEQVIAREIDHRSDIYSLGVVLFECVTGEPPFTGEVQSLLYRIVHEYPRSIRSVRPNISAELDEIILCCLQKDPARRYQKVSELGTALRRCQSRLGESGKSVVLSAVLTAAIDRPPTAQLIDREKEFAELQRHLNAAVAGECRFVALGGDAGIGKSRLVEELENLARARRISVVRGRFVEQDRALAFHGLLEVIHDYFRGREAGSSGATPSDFSDVAGELVSVFPSLADIAPLRAAASSAGDAMARRTDDRSYVFELLARSIIRMSSEKPLVVVLENIHAAEGSLDALQYIVPRLASAPVLVIGTYRQTEVARGHPLARMLDAFRGDPRFQSIVLGPLTPSHHRDLVLSVMGGGTITPELAERVYRATEGNPFFTRELMRSLVESSGVVRDDTGAWSLSGAMAISSDALPATIQQAVERRVERLPDDVREVLAVASVVGRSFEYADLEALVEDPKGLEKSVDRLVADGLLEEDREARGDRLAFTSAIVRDVLYGSISKRRRRALHRRCAEHLEKSSRRLESLYAQLVHHYSEGDVPEKSVQYGLLHARRSLESFSADEASQVLRVVIDFASDTEWQGDRSAEAEARLLLARAHRLQAAHAAAVREAESAHRLFLASGDPSRALDALLFTAHATWDARKIDEAKKWVDQGLDLARTTSRLDVLGDLLSLGATIANLRADYERAKHYLDEAERLKGQTTAHELEIAAGGTLRCAMVNITSAEEPAARITDEDAEILSLVFENVVTTDESGRVRGALARAWELGDGGRTLRLEIDPAAHFADGSPVRAADVKVSFERAARVRRDTTLAALQPIVGIDEFRDGTAATLAGIRAVSDGELLIDLQQPLALYPALLTDPSMAVVKVAGDALIGSGPFRFLERSPGKIVLVRNENAWKGRGPRIDRIEFELCRDAEAIEAAFRAGRVDVARDLSPRALEDLMRDARLGPSVIEAPRKTTYFLLFNQSGPAADDADLRAALVGALNVSDLVWRSIGRSGQPATSLIPPSIFGHDAGRRTESLTREVVSARLDGVRQRMGVDRIRLVAGAVPAFVDRYGTLAEAIVATWRDLGVDVEIRAQSMDDYLASVAAGEGIDLLLARWSADYDDGDNFSRALFQSENGFFRAYFSSAAADELFEQTRVEGEPSLRESLYQSFENLLRRESRVLPLFYEVAHRVASRRVRGIRLRSNCPYVNYAELGVAEIAESDGVELGLRTSEIHAPIIEETRSIDPADMMTFNDAEIIHNVFEALTRFGEGARTVPHLAESFAPENGGRRWRFRLREGVRFHDGRRVTARDVRYSWERRLGRSRLQLGIRHVKGVAELASGEARELEGFHIVSPLEFVIELTEPIAFFPSLAGSAETAVVPEGTSSASGSWREGCVGTGPFRVVEFQSGRYLELERNPDYWRPGLPKIDRLIFHLGLTPESIVSEFKAGRLSLASDLSPAHIEQMLHDPEVASRFHSAPRLCIYYAALNVHSPLLSDVAVRRGLFGAVDTDAMVQRAIGRIATPASGVIPPGLLGHTGVRPPTPPGNRAALRGLRLRAAVQPMFRTQFGAFTRLFEEALASCGVTLDVVNETGQEYLDAVKNQEPDVVIGRWMGSVPDADYFTTELLATHDSFLGHLSGIPEIDALTNRARSEPSVGARHSLYRQIEETIAREALMLPLFHEQACRFVAAGVEGLVMHFTHPEVSYDLLRKSQK